MDHGLGWSCTNISEVYFLRRPIHPAPRLPTPSNPSNGSGEPVCGRRPEFPLSLLPLLLAFAPDALWSAWELLELMAAPLFWLGLAVVDWLLCVWSVEVLVLASGVAVPAVPVVSVALEFEPTALLWPLAGDVVSGGGVVELLAPVVLWSVVLGLAVVCWLCVVWSVLVVELLGYWLVCVAWGLLEDVVPEVVVLDDPEVPPACATAIPAVNSRAVARVNTRVFIMRSAPGS